MHSRTKSSRECSDPNGWKLRKTISIWPYWSFGQDEVGGNRGLDAMYVLVSGRAIDEVTSVRPPDFARIENLPALRANHPLNADNLRTGLVSSSQARFWVASR